MCEYHIQVMKFIRSFWRYF